MKKGLIIAGILIAIGLLLTSAVEAQPPSIPLMLDGVEGCEIEFNGEIYYSDSNNMILSGEEGDVIIVSKDGVTKRYYYANPMDNPFLYIDMKVKVEDDEVERRGFTPADLRWILAHGGYIY